MRKIETPLQPVREPRHVVDSQSSDQMGKGVESTGGMAISLQRILKPQRLHCLFLLPSLMT